MLNSIPLIAASAFYIASSTTWAAAEAQRSPNLDGQPISRELLSASDGVLELNPTGSSVKLVPGLSSITQVAVDAEFGVVRGRAAYSVSESISTNAAYFSNAVGSVLGSGVLAGPAGSTATIRATFAFDGSFFATAGFPFMQLGGTLSADNVTTDKLYISQLYFNTTNGNSAIDTYSLAVTRPISEPFQEIPYSRAAPHIVSSNAANLAGIAVVEFEAKVGDEVGFRADLQGIVMPYFQSATYAPSSASVDFLNSGRFGISLPVGYTLNSQDVLFDNVVSSVPEASTFSLLVAGMAALLLWRRTKVFH